MQKNGKFYTYLLSYLFNSNINPRKIRKDLFHSAIILFFLVVGFSAIGIGIRGVLSRSSFDTNNSGTPLLAQVSAQVTDQNEVYDYSRPTDAYTPNSGGPASTEADPESVEIQNRLSAIQAIADPAFIPSVWAHMGKINNEFGFRRNPFGGRTYEFHPGMDIYGERGEEVLAPANGVVIKAAWTGGYGNMVEIDHGNGLTTRYGHMSKIEVEVGDTITRGQVLGLIGSTGRSTGPHLHYELRLDDRPVNPRHYLPPEPINITAPER
ncbi:MAG: M23 family metallopeptidase [Acidobacteriota bacterium]